MSESQKMLWKQILEDLSIRLSFGVFEGVILQAKPGRVENGKLTMHLPFPYLARRLSAEERKIVETVISEKLGKPIKVEYSILPESGKIKATKLAIVAQQTINARKELLNKKGGKNSGGNSSPSGGNRRGSGSCNETMLHLKSTYKFESFVVGESNRLAYAASMSVAKDPGKRYNPLFIHSPSGLGKSHLLHGIGHMILKTHPEMRIQLTSAESYTNELIESINDKERSRRFRSKFRHCDILLIDDIHFLIGKDATKEAFFYTFNELDEMGKQIVLTCDRHPRELLTLESRLISRFHLGLIVDIQRPAYETRLAILNKKASEMKINISNETMECFASNIKGSIRSLVGCLQAADLYEKTYGPIDSLEVANKIANDYSHERNPHSDPITVKDILDLMCHHYKLDLEELNGKSRESRLTHPRHIGMYLSRKHTALSLQAIARAFKRKDHTSVYHGANKIESRISIDAVLAREVKYIEDILLGKSQMK